MEFVDQYAMLEKRTKNVTARTLVATRIHGRGFFHAAFQTSVGQYLVMLGIITSVFLYFMVSGLIKQEITLATPFFAAGLGTCVYLLRVTQEGLKTREFDPAYIPSHLIRLGLGILAGGSIVLFPDLVKTGLDTVQTADVGLGQAALAFLLGYAVDVFYAVLDNIGGKIRKNHEIVGLQEA
jgi:hypothetical protein